jgi:hypothetical protein
MKNSDWLVRTVARYLVILLAIPFGDAAQARAQQPAPAIAEQSNAAGQNSQQDSTGSPATPGVDVGQPGKLYPDAPDAQNGQSVNAQAGAEPQQNDDVRPLGTAAAPYSKPSGVMGSRPAGVVIAPAKQRRVRAILISVGVVAGAAIAIGTVAALSHGSPSRP